MYYYYAAVILILFYDDQCQNEHGTWTSKRLSLNCGWCSPGHPRLRPHL